MSERSTLKQGLVRLTQHLLIVISIEGVASILWLTDAAQLCTGFIFVVAFTLLIGIRYFALRNTRPQANLILVGALCMAYSLFALFTGKVGAVTVSGYVIVAALSVFLLPPSSILYANSLSVIGVVLLFAAQRTFLFVPLLVLPEWVNVISYVVILAIIADVAFLLTSSTNAEKITAENSASPSQPSLPMNESPLSVAPVDTLRESAEQLRIIFDEALDVFIVLDNDEKIVRVNAAVEPILGYTPDELVGRNFSSLLPADNVSPISESISSDDALFDALLFLRKDGTLCPIELTATIIPWENDVAILITLRDVSKHEELRRELEASRQKMQYQQDLMEDRLNLIFMVAHQLRTPLSTILTSTEMLERYGERLDTTKRVEHLDKVKSQALYLRQMMSDMLAARDAMAGKLQFITVPLNLEAYCQGIFDAFVSIQDKEKYIFSFTSEITTPLALLDKTLLNYMLDNLLTNAVKYSPDGGHVQMTVTEVDNQFVIAIADEGIGVPESARENLFDMFYRADNVNAIKGTGIGLGLAYMSAKAHSGTITYDSAVGKGSTFYIHIPVVPVNKA